MFNKLNKKVSFVSGGIIALFVLWAIIAPENVQSVFSVLFNFFIQKFGWFYLLAAVVFVLFCFIVAFSKFGKIKLGKDDEEPVYSTFSWFAMLFSAGMGIGLVFWGVAEPINHFAISPFAEDGTREAAVIALRTCFFHWGIHPWASYGVMAIALGYFQFRKGLPALASSIFHPILGDEGIRGPIGKTIDIVTVIITLMGVATSLGLGTLQVVTGLEMVYGFPNSLLVRVIFIAVVTVIFIISARSGIEKGIKWLSNINMSIAAILLIFLAIVGPTLWLVNIFTESIGSYLNNVIPLSFFTDSAGVVAEKTGYDWVGGWTVFYWAWWITWVPFVGSFLARISRGRTIREFVLAGLVAPTILSAIWFTVVGGSAIHLELFGIGGIVDATFNDVSTAIFVTFNGYPLTNLLSTLAMLMVTIFFLTSADSATFVLGMYTCNGDLEPDNSVKSLWGIFIGFTAIALLLSGGLSAVQTVSFVLGGPYMLLMLVMIYSVVKALSRDKEYLAEESKYTLSEEEKIG